MYLFAQTEAASAGFLPAEFWPSLLMAAIYVVVALVFFAIFWKVIHFITPGDLDREILGHDEEKKLDGTVVSREPPNIALAIIVGCMVIGFCMIITAAIK